MLKVSLFNYKYKLRGSVLEKVSTVLAKDHSYSGYWAFTWTTEAHIKAVMMVFY
jgi:hypothetical protein